MTFKQTTSSDTAPIASPRSWHRRLKRTGIGLAAAVLLTIGVRTTVAEMFVVPVASMEPEIPQDGRVLVYKLAGDFQPGQIIAYRHTTGAAWLGRVDAFDPATGELTINRNGTGQIMIDDSAVIGRVVLSTR